MRITDTRSDRRRRKVVAALAVATVGSGDAFLAAFLAAYYQHKGVPAALDLACATGAYVASQAGANPDYQFSDIEAFLAERSA